MTQATSEADVRTWTTERNGSQYVCSTDTDLLPLDVYNDALGSPELWWASRLPVDRLRKVLQTSVIFGVYHIEAGRPHLPVDHLRGKLRDIDSLADKRTLVGSARLVTDRVTVAYMTDVYILQEHQKRGLAVWLMECLKELIDSWPELRSLQIPVANEGARRIYEKVLGASLSPGDSPVKLLWKYGPHHQLFTGGIA